MAFPDRESTLAAAHDGCPVAHVSATAQKTVATPVTTSPAVELDAHGVWHVREFEAARAILRADQTRQAGFGAEIITELPSTMNPPILFMEGAAHHEQRRRSARFFTPRTTDSLYRDFMHQYAAGLVSRLRHGGKVDLSQLSMEMAVQVAAQVVGLTHSRLPGMERRIDRFLRLDPTALGWKLNQIASFLETQRALLLFYLLDVRPAIQARRRQRREDVISHLLDQDYSPMEILTECVTYGAAGMVTTREFISVVTWHCLENPEYCRLMLTAEQDERYRFLHELLRLEPVVGQLLRRLTADLTVETKAGPVTLPAGALVQLHINAVNTDASVVGEEPLQVCPGRKMKALRPRVPEYVMGFGDGHHRCPGAYIAIQETDIFVRELLALPGLRLVQPPEVHYNEVAKGYELRHFILATTPTG